MLQMQHNPKYPLELTTVQPQLDRTGESQVQQAIDVGLPIIDPIVARVLRFQIHNALAR